MDTSARASVPGSDAELLNTIRSGDPDAFGALRARHAGAARSLARHLAAGQDPDEIVAVAFTQVLEAITRGGGPSDAFRPYLLTAIRRVAGGAGDVPADEQQIPDPGQPLAGERPAPIVAAFLSLPERWRAVLWHVEIERAAPADVAPLLGLTAAGVAELASRARDGLARAYRQAQEPTGRHQYAAPAGPADARAGAALRGTVAEIFLGAATTAYLAELAPPANGGRAGRTAAMAAATAATAAAASSLASGVAWLRGRPREQRAIAAGVGSLIAVAAIAVSVLTFGTPGGNGAGHRPAGAAGEPSAPVATVPPAHPSTTAAAGTPTAPPRPHTHAPSAPPPTEPVTAPSSAPPPAPASPQPPPPSKRPRRPKPPQPPAPTARVSADISVFGPGAFGRVAMVSFGVTDGGPAATSDLAAHISLPADTQPMTSGRGTWSCQASSGGAACAHGPIGAAARTGGLLAIAVTGPAACGQHVQVTVTGGSSPVSAQSSGTIECRRHWRAATVGRWQGTRWQGARWQGTPWPGWQWSFGRWPGGWPGRRY